MAKLNIESALLMGLLLTALPQHADLLLLLAAAADCSQQSWSCWLICAAVQ